ncbi:MAG: type III pantothenate kinase [Gammaproteobacteria bacterium]|nr:type III pantothenate kinase [Gammaproteobacteria bacterium]MBU1655418.1 type III pantothenate kinase [Gammaproteobacteria bacterium]MBU1962163.1 type III pantothenate kinase [Gammaproteobacteria bacterium]
MASILLVDIGNSRLKWALLLDGIRGAQHSEPYRPGQLVALLPRIWQGIRPQRILIASVASEAVNREIAHWSEATWGLPPEFMRSQAQCLGVTNGYREPERLGIDRWLALIAAYHRCGGSVGVVDAGSAVTIDLVDGQGRHRGGWILPGVALQGRCLRANTAIPAFDDLAPVLAPGHATAEAIANGGLLAVAGAIEQAARIVAVRGDLPGIRWVLTGGDGDRLANLLTLEFEIMDGLVMDGLHLMADPKTGFVNGAAMHH